MFGGAAQGMGWSPLENIPTLCIKLVVRLQIAVSVYLKIDYIV